MLLRCHVAIGSAVFLLSISHAFAQTEGFGLGIIIGEPTGISAKGWVSRENAIDAGMAWSFRDRGFLHLHADYLWHFQDVIRSSELFPLYIGVGGRLGAGRGRAIFGVRIPGGILWWPRNAPIDVFFELVPILDLAPATELSVNGGIGARFYFK